MNTNLLVHEALCCVKADEIGSLHCSGATPWRQLTSRRSVFLTGRKLNLQVEIFNFWIGKTPISDSAGNAKPYLKFLLGRFSKGCLPCLAMENGTRLPANTKIFA